MSVNRRKRRHIIGGELAVTIRNDLIEHVTGDAGPYNATFTTNGIASTTVTIIAASLGVLDLLDLVVGTLERSKVASLLATGDTRWITGRPMT